MIDKLIYEYKKLFGFRYRYFNKMNILSKILFCFLSLTIVVLPSIFVKSMRLYEIGLWVFAIILHVFYVYIKMNQIDVKRFGKVKRTEIRMMLILEYRKTLRNNHIPGSNEKQMSELLRYLDVCLTDMKPGDIIKKGSIAGVFIPLWVGYVNRNYALLSSAQDTFMFLSIVSIVIFIIFILVFIYREGIIQELVFSEYKRLKDIRNIVWELLILEYPKG